MSFRSSRIVVAATWLLVLVCAPLLRAEWKAGAAKICITPEQPMWMAGYGARDRASEGKLTDLWAKALVLEDGQGRRGVLISLDLVGLDRATSESICQRLAEAHGFTREQIALCASHTHTGPVVGKNLAPLHYELVDGQQRQRIDAYTESLLRRVVEVVGSAAANLTPSRLSWGSGIATFAANRRNNREPDVPQLRAAAALLGPCDFDVPVLAVHDPKGRLSAVVFGYACHATVLSFYQWSGDYPGFAQAELEQRHDGCVALFWAGCGADQNPLPRRTVELAQHYGSRLATAVDAVLLTTRMVPIADTLVTRYREVDLPLDTLPTHEQLQREAQSPQKPLAARAALLLAELQRGTPLPQTYPYPIGVWGIGEEITFVTLGGEVVVDYSLRLKNELSGLKTWVAGYAHDVMAYIPSRRVLTEGGYEGADAMVYYGLPTRWAPEVEEIIIAAVRQEAETARAD